MLVSLIPELPDWHLVIAGDGPLRLEIEAQARTLGIAERVFEQLFEERAELALRRRLTDAHAQDTAAPRIPLAEPEQERHRQLGVQHFAEFG